MTNSHQTITKEAMAARDLTKILSIEGTIILKAPLCVFWHMIDCAQNIVTKKYLFNFLFLVLSATIWNIYSNEPYLMPPGCPGTNAPYVPSKKQACPEPDDKGSMERGEKAL